MRASPSRRPSAAKMSSRESMHATIASRRDGRTSRWRCPWRAVNEALFAMSSSITSTPEPYRNRLWSELPLCGAPQPHERREHQEQDRPGHPRPSDRDGSAHADLFRDERGHERADGVADAVRDHFERRVDASEDRVWDDALDE